MWWQDEGVVLAARRHGESSAVVSLFTRAHGRHAGLVRGGAGRRARALYQAGNALGVTWRARLLDHPDRLAALGAACALLEASLPERDPHPTLYINLLGLADVLLEDESWAERYVR